MATKFDVINAALTRVGEPSITEVDDGSAGSNIAGANYDQIVSAALTGHPWRWATKTEVLAQVTGTPAPPWLYAYQLPTDLLELRVVEVAGYPIDYERQFTKLLCDADTAAEVIAKYTWNVPEAYWPAVFAEAIVQYLEALFLRGIGERYDEAEARQKDAMRTMSAARLRDSQGGQSARDPVVSSTLRARGAVYPAGSLLDARWR